MESQEGDYAEDYDVDEDSEQVQLQLLLSLLKGGDFRHFGKKLAFNHLPNLEWLDLRKSGLIELPEGLSDLSSLEVCSVNVGFIDLNHVHQKSFYLIWNFCLFLLIPWIGCHLFFLTLPMTIVVGHITPHPRIEISFVLLHHVSDYPPSQRLSLNGNEFESVAASELPLVQNIDVRHNKLSLSAL